MREAVITPRHEVDGTKADAMATKATKRATMNFMVLLGCLVDDKGAWVMAMRTMWR